MAAPRRGHLPFGMEVAQGVCRLEREPTCIYSNFEAEGTMAVGAFVLVCLLSFVLATLSYSLPQSYLRIIPSPQSVTVTEESFALSRIASISFTSGDRESLFAASQLADEWRESAGIPASVGRGASGAVVLARVPAADSEADALLQRLPDAGIEGSYALSVGHDRIVLAYTAQAETDDRCRFSHNSRRFGVERVRPAREGFSASVSVPTRYLYRSRLCELLLVQAPVQPASCK